MIISHKYKYLFIHVPRTAGTSIEYWLWKNTKCDVLGYWDGSEENENKKIDRELYCHISAYDLREKFVERNWNWDEYNKFACVRNPYDLLVSNYFYSFQPISQHAKWSSDVNQYPTFKEYIMGRFNKIDEYTRYYGSPHFLCDRDNNVLVDTILKYENLQEEFTKHIDSIVPTKDTTLPLKNVSKRGHYTDYYDAEMLEVLKKIIHPMSLEIGNYDYLTFS